MTQAQIEWQKTKDEFFAIEKEYQNLSFFQKILRGQEFNHKFQKNLSIAKYWESQGGRVKTQPVEGKV